MNLKHSAAELGRQIGAGKLAPEDLTEALLEATLVHPMAGRIYARLTPDRARAEARAAGERARSGTRRGLLDGVPLSWKDLYDSAGTATEAGSALLKGRTPDHDAEVLATATAGGSVCLGKTHMSELAFSGLGLNPVTATPPCVNDHAAVAGGSSSGAAASVAFGLAPAAIGSDTGGSIRIPAAWNDLVGFKPTHGALPLTGVVPLAASYDTVGPLTRTVEDAAEITALLGGAKAPDLTGATVKGLKFLRISTTFEEDLRSEPASGYESALSRLAKSGAEITTIRLTIPAEALALAGVLVASEAYATWKDLIESAPDKMFAPVLARFRGGADYSAVEYVRALQALTKLRAAFVDAISSYDAVVLPTSAILPPNVDRLLSDETYFARENLLALRNTRIGNLLGVTAITLPTGTASVGVSLWAAPGHDRRLLRVAAGAERALA